MSPVSRRTPPDHSLPAVQRAYQEMRAKGQPDHVALEAAITVYKWHHPLIPKAEAIATVFGWVWEGPVH